MTMTFVEGFASASGVWLVVGLLFLRAARRRVRSYLTETLVQMKTSMDQRREPE